MTIWMPIPYQRQLSWNAFPNAGAAQNIYAFALCLSKYVRLSCQLSLKKYPSLFFVSFTFIIYRK